MSCSCGATRIADCPVIGQVAAELEIGGVGDDGPTNRVWRALWCLLHPTQCRRDPKTGRPIPALQDVIVLGAIVFAWWKLTDER